MRGRVSDPFQPLRAAHKMNAPGFAGGWLLVRAAPPDAPASRVSTSRAKSVDERIWEDMKQDRKVQELELRIGDIEGAINGRNNQMNLEMAAIRERKAYAKNNLAGATWEQSLSTEMQAVASKYKAMNDADFERLKVLRSELDAVRAPTTK